MARKTKAETLQALHQQAMADFGHIQVNTRDQRKQCQEDRRFATIAGAMWEGPLGETFENRIKLEVNKIGLAVLRIINEYRNNRITVRFTGKYGDDDGDELADVCAGLYRADEYRSTAEEAYDNAFEEAVLGGIGAWRLRAEYEDDEDEYSDRQCIWIEPIVDADTNVFFDLNAKRQDKSDARFCYVLTPTTRDAYKEEWGDDPTSWPKHEYADVFDWQADDVVFVAEYYRVEEYTKRVQWWRDVMGNETRHDADDLDEADVAQMMAVGSEMVREKPVKRKRVRKYIMSGGGVLEDCGYIAGTCIPIVPVYGRRWYIDNIERCSGHVRNAKDSARLKNMQLSRLAETSALSGMEKPIFLPEQVAGHERLWSDDASQDYPFLLINPVRDANDNEVASGPVGYTKPPMIPPALAALLQITEDDLADILGRQEQGEQVGANLSGVAVEMVQQRLDMQSFVYMDNMAKAVRRCGEIWLSMAKDVYVEENRKAKLMDAEGDVEAAILNQLALDGGAVTKNEMSAANFDVRVDVGPSSSSRRAATVRALTGMMGITQDPETLTVLSSMAMMNMEGEGVRDVRQWFRKRLLRMGVLEPTEQEAQEMAAEQQNAPQDPNAVYLQAEASKAQAQAIESQADMEYTLARAEETRAKTAKTLSEIETDQRRAVVDTAEKLQTISQRAQPPMGREPGEQ